MVLGSEMGTKTHSKLSKPVLTVVCLLLAERQLNEVAVPILRRTKWDHVLCHVREVVTGVRILARSEALKRK
jgi:hypothetical protein